MKKIKVGDVVTLKILSPKMTVEKIYKGVAHCVWFDNATQQVLRDNFSVQILKG